MKKFSKTLSVLVLSILVLTGCGKDKKEVMTCTRTLNQNNVEMGFTYKINYTGDYVNTIETTEEVKSENAEYLNTLKTAVENTYAPYKNVEHYNYNVKIDGNKLVSTTKIDYDKIDTKKLIELDSANGKLIKDGKVKMNDLKQVYESLGATCK
mgnify:CR=1 FL=1